MSGIEEGSQQLQGEVQAALDAVRRAETEQTRAQAAVEAADADYQRALAQLREEFGVGTAVEAKALLDDLTGQLREEMQKVVDALAEASPEEATR